MTYSIRVERKEPHNDIDVKCEDYAVDERGLSLLNPNIVNKSCGRTSEVTYINRDTIVSINVSELDNEGRTGTERVKG